MTDNVIKFPKTNKRIPELPTVEDLKTDKGFSPTDEAVDTATEIISSVMLEHMLALGYIPRENTGKEICFVIESVRALMKKYYGQTHPFHPLAELSFEPHESGAMEFIEPESISTTTKRKRPKKKTSNTDIVTT